jgi:heme-degrading monooxygenase HmoA
MNKKNKMMNNDKVVVIFEVKLQNETMEHYLKYAAGLKTKLSKMEGFVSAERFASMNEEGKLISVSFWENEEAAAKWRNHVEHRKSQKTGHDSLFEKYRITVASVIREYTNEDRTEAPRDSNEYLNIE